ncbi:MAG: PAS domain S-box protein, partial [Bacteroidales bacterium]|nr:PAS domain S-box protein [Bacteroidales bacterium]
NISDLFPPAQLNEKPLRYDLLDSGQSIILEREIIRKDGKIVSVEMNSTKMQDGTYQSFFRDITERKKAEEVLRESENRFKKLASFTFEGIIIHNNAIAIDVNQSTLKLLGYKKDEIIGMNLFSLIHPDYHAIVKNNINKQVASPYHIVAIKKDGTTFDAEIEARNIAYNNEDFRALRETSPSENRQK